jgi:hypothetical protein
MIVHTKTKMALVAGLVLALASAAQAREGGTQPDLPSYNEPAVQQSAHTAFAQQTPRHNQGRNAAAWSGTLDNPPGSAFQDEGNREASGYPGR